MYAATTLYSLKYGSLWGGCDHCLWALPFCRRNKTKKNENTSFIKCFKQEKRKENFTLWTSERWEAKIFQIFWNEFFEIWKLETVVAHRHWKAWYKIGTVHKNRRNTDFNFKVHKNVQLHIILLCDHQNRFNTTQKAIFLLKVWTF